MRIYFLIYNSKYTFSHSTPYYIIFLDIHNAIQILYLFECSCIETIIHHVYVADFKCIYKALSKIPSCYVTDIPLNSILGFRDLLNSSIRTSFRSMKSAILFPNIAEANGISNLLLLRYCRYRSEPSPSSAV